LKGEESAKLSGQERSFMFKVNISAKENKPIGHGLLYVTDNKRFSRKYNKNWIPLLRNRCQFKFDYYFIFFTLILLYHSPRSTQIQ